jgi:hypothetical protein
MVLPHSIAKEVTLAHGHDDRFVAEQLLDGWVDLAVEPFKNGAISARPQRSPNQGRSSRLVAFGLTNKEIASQPCPGAAVVPQFHEMKQGVLLNCGLHHLRKAIVLRGFSLPPPSTSQVSREISIRIVVISPD